VSEYQHGYDDGRRDGDPYHNERTGQGCITFVLLALAPLFWPVGTALTIPFVFGLYEYGHLFLPFINWKEPAYLSLLLAGVIFFCTVGMRIERGLARYKWYWGVRHVFRLLMLFGLAALFQATYAQNNPAFQQPGMFIVALVVPAILIYPLHRFLVKIKPK